MRKGNNFGTESNGMDQGSRVLGLSSNTGYEVSHSFPGLASSPLPRFGFQGLLSDPEIVLPIAADVFWARVTSCSFLAPGKISKSLAYIYMRCTDAGSEEWGFDRWLRVPDSPSLALLS